MLTLSEELLLLALDDEKGTVPAAAQTPLRFGLAAAGLAELLMAGRIAIEEKKKAVVVEGVCTSDEILEEMAERIRSGRRPKSLGDWVKDFGNGGIKRLQERLEAGLVARGILRSEEGRYLRLIPWHHYPTVDGGPEAETRERLRAVLVEGEEPDPRTAILVGLARSCHLTGRLFPKEERKLVEQRAKSIARGQFAGEAVSKAVEEVAAATAAIIAVSAAGSSATS